MAIIDIKSNFSLISCLNPNAVIHIFFFNDTATTEIYTLSLHDALPIYGRAAATAAGRSGFRDDLGGKPIRRSEEHTSELQSQFHLVCRLLLEKKKKKNLTMFVLYKKNNIYA